MIYATNYDDNWYAASFGCTGNGPYAFAVQCLNIEMPFGGNQKISRREIGVKV